MGLVFGPVKAVFKVPKTKKRRGRLRKSAYDLFESRPPGQQVQPRKNQARCHYEGAVE